MRFLPSVLLGLLAAERALGTVSHTWEFIDASVSVRPKHGDGDPESHKISKGKPFVTPLSLGPHSTLRLQLTTTESGKAKRPHQAFLLLQEPVSGLEAPFPLKVKESGKATVDITQQDLPLQLLLASESLQATVVLGSFGVAAGVVTPVFHLQVKLDPQAARPEYELPTRYGKRPEINHNFRAAPRSPPAVVSFYFATVVLAALPVLFITWLSLGANLGDLTQALYAAPLAHMVFFGSIVGIEFVFFLYYAYWNLFQTLLAFGLLSVVAFLSGTRALGELQGRRIADMSK